MKMNYSFQFRLLKESLALLLALASMYAKAQQVPEKPSRHPVRNIAWFTPSNATQVNGLAVGLQNINFSSQKVTVNGLNTEVGMITMFLIPYTIADVFSTKDNILKFQHPDSTGACVNGITLSVGGNAGTAANGLCISGAVSHLSKMNGLAVTGLFSRVYRFHGITFAGIRNHAKEGWGLQVGLFNRCEQLKGVQIGLWNKAGKSGFPFINLRL